MSSRWPKESRAGTDDHCRAVSAITNAVAIISGPSRLAGRRHQAMVPLIRYGTVIQLNKNACRPGRTSSAPAIARRIDTTSVARPPTTVAHSATGPGPCGNRAAGSSVDAEATRPTPSPTGQRAPIPRPRQWETLRGRGWGPPRWYSGRGTGVDPQPDVGTSNTLPEPGTGYVVSEVPTGCPRSPAPDQGAASSGYLVPKE